MQQHLLSWGVERVAEVDWELDAFIHDSPRHFAVTETVPGRWAKVRVAPALEEVSKEHQQGILLHEWGHVVDFLYPEQILVVGPFDVRWFSPTPEEVKAWHERNAFQKEARADEIVLGFWGVGLCYRGDLLLQGWSGVPRPVDLR